MAIEKGTHEARPLNFQFGKSSKKQTEMVSVTFVFVGGPNDGKRISWSGYFTDATAERTMDALEYCGWDGDDIKTLKGFGSKNVELVIEEEQGQDGNMYPRVQWVNKVFSRGIPMEEGELDGFASRLSSINAARKRKKQEAETDPDPFGNG